MDGSYIKAMLKREKLYSNCQTMEYKTLCKKSVEKWEMIYWLRKKILNDMKRYEQEIVN